MTPLLLTCSIILCIPIWTLALTFEVFPTTLKHSGANVTLHWTNLSSPSELDWIGVYTPPDSVDSHYIGYVLLSSYPEWSKGSGFWSIPLINMREPYQFRLFRGSTTNRHKNHKVSLPSTAHRLLVSENVKFESFNEPTQVHLSLASANEEMRVMFVTRDPVKSYVRYGLSSDNLSFQTETAFLTYQQSDMCDSPANTDLGWREPGYIHDAVMDNLEPGQSYFYQVGSDEGGWSGVFNFTSFDRDADETNAFLFGDMGTSVPYTTFLWTQAESTNTIKWLLRDLADLDQKPSFVSHIGDISYARGYAWLWDAFFSQIEPVAARAPYHVCIGNHEYDWPSQPWKPSWAEHDYGTDGGGECGIPYSLRFLMPGNSSLATGAGSISTRNLYYSLNFGVVHFLYFSTETNFLPGSDQHNFIVEDLRSVNRYHTPFVVVLGHRPMYTSDYESPLMLQMREHLEPLIVQYKVDLALWGHVHKYERTCPMENFRCVDSTSGQTLPVHVVIGMGGQDWQSPWMPSHEHPNDPIYPQPSWSLYRSDELGYTRLHASRNTMTLSYVGNHDGQVHDTVTIHASNVSTSGLYATPQAQNWSWHVSVGSLVLLVVASMFGAGIGFALALLYRHQEKKSDWIQIRNNDLDL